MSTPPTASSSASQLPLLHHQYVAMVHVYQRIFICSMILPLSFIIFPITLRIVYRFLKLCVIGLSKREHHSTDDVVVISSVVTTMLFTHLFTTKFSYLQSYLHSLATKNDVEEQRCSLLEVNDDKDHSKTWEVEDETSKENSHHGNEKIDTSSQVDGKDAGQSDTSISNKAPLKERFHQNNGPALTKDTAVTTKDDETTAAHPQQPLPKKSPKTMSERIQTKTKPNASDSIPGMTSGSTATTTVYISAFVFLFICALTRYICHGSYHHPYVTGKLFPSHSRLTNTSTSSRTLPDYLLPSFITTIRFSVCMMLYAFMVALRFFGPASFSK
jgi:hypothetical protein